MFIRFFSILFFFILSASVFSQSIEQDDLYFTKKDRQQRIKKKKKRKEVVQEEQELVVDDTKQLIKQESEGQYFNWVDQSNSRPVDSLVSGYQPLYASDLDVIDPRTGYVIPYSPLLEPTISNGITPQYIYPTNNTSNHSPNYYQGTNSNVPGQTNSNENRNKVVKRKQPIRRMSTTIKRTPIKPVEKVRRPVQISKRQPTYTVPSFSQKKEKKSSSSNSNSSTSGSPKRRVIRR